MMLGDARRSLLGGGAAVAMQLFADAADGASYSLIAQAGGADESAPDETVSSVSALYSNPAVVEGGMAYELYSASADGTGSLAASCESLGVPPFAAINHRAAARIEETIRLPKAPYPNGPVTVTVGLGGGVGASSLDGSVAGASSGVTLENSCYASDSSTSGLSGYCPAGTVSGLSVTRTFSLALLGNLSWEIDVAAQVEARCELFHAAGTANAHASGGLYVTVSGGGVESYTWTGTNTSIPAPEPAAGAIGAAALGALAALRRPRG